MQSLVQSFAPNLSFSGDSAMRIPKPFFRKQTQSFYLQLNGKQINLGKDKAQAMTKYHEIMAGKQEPLPDITAAALLDMFLGWCKASREPRTYQFYFEHLQSFIDYIGKTIQAMDVKPLHVTQWVGTRNGGETHKYNAASSLKRGFAWGAEQGIIPFSTLARYKPDHRPQPREVYIQPQQWQALIDKIKPGPFKNVVLFLRQTGCRPFELRRIEAKNIDGQCIVFERKKSKGKRVRRVIPLTKQAFAIVKQLANENPTGPIFRNEKGRPWTKSALGHAFQRHAKKMMFPLFAYAIRHSFCTDMLTQGMDPLKLAEIMGHKDLKMIMTVYSHLNLKRDELRQQLEKCVNANDATPDHPTVA
jgi:integrase